MEKLLQVDVSPHLTAAVHTDTVHHKCALSILFTLPLLFLMTTVIFPSGTISSGEKLGGLFPL
jgi:hypothetical protein